MVSLSIICLVGRSPGCVVSQSDSLLVGLFVCLSVVWSFGFSVCMLADRSVVQLVGWSVSPSVSQLIVELVGQLVGLEVNNIECMDR